MKYLVSLLSTLFFCCTAIASPATPTSIDKLLKVMETEKTLQSIKFQIDGMMKSTIEQATQGQAVSPEQQKILDTFRQKAVSAINEQLDFNKLKSIYIQIYSESFLEEEITSLIAFYESPTGKMFVAKMPLVTQKSMLLMQQSLNPIMQRIQQYAGEMKQEMDTLKQNAPK